MALSGATTPGLCRPGSNGNEVLLNIPQSSRTAGTSPSDCILQPQLTGQFTELNVKQIFQII